MMEKVTRSVVMNFTFPASMSVEEQDVILEQIKILPFEKNITVPERPGPDPDDPDTRYDQRRVVGYDEITWSKAINIDKNALVVRSVFPSWLPKEIAFQANKKIPLAAAEIVNEYLAKRLVGTEE